MKSDQGRMTRDANELTRLARLAAAAGENNLREALLLRAIKASTTPTRERLRLADHYLEARRLGDALG
jgi:hypothetical protein